MTKVTTSIASVLFSAASIALAPPGAAAPLVLNAAQMDGITAGQEPASATASALADAQGRFTMIGTNASSTVTATRQQNQQAGQVVYLAVNGASANVTALGEGSQSAITLAGTNNLPVPNDSVMTTTVQGAQSVLGVTIAFQSQLAVGGNNIYYLLHPSAIFGKK